MEADMYTTLDEDTEKKMIYKMARQRNEYSKYVNLLREEHLSITERGS